MRPLGACLLAASLVATLACGRLRGISERLSPPTPTPTPGWVGKIQETSTPLATYQARVADTDPVSGRPITYAIALRDGPGRGADPTGFSVQPGERVFITGVETIGNERFFKVRSFDGLKRGWLAESTIAAGDRPHEASSPVGTGPQPSPSPSGRGQG